ncbi:hypothetical protein HP550_05860, partial [Cellulomonas humilata]|nr:hypothetical protein [Cellulomonas humilata]
MRWPWQRARPPLGAPTVQRVAGPPAESRAGWAFLPPLQRTVGDAELTSAPMAFVDALPTRARPMLTGPMSHAVSPVAPSGVLDGDGGRLATPSTRSSDIDLALVPPAPRPTPGRPAVAVQRQATGTLVGLGAPPADVPPLHAVPLDTDLEGAAADGEGLGGPEWPAPVGDVPILSAPDGDVPVPSVAVAGTPVPSAPAGALPIPWAAAGAPTGPGAQRSATPLVPAPPAADRAGSEEGATFVELPSRLAGREPDPAPPATVQRRIGLGAPLRA